MTHLCDACGYPNLDQPQHYPDGEGSLEICPCCLYQPGFDDLLAASGLSTSPEEYRRQWLAEGAPWRSDIVPPPPGWDPCEQVKAVQGVR